MVRMRVKQKRKYVNILMMKREWWMKVNRTMPTSISFQNLKTYSSLQYTYTQSSILYLFCLSLLLLLLLFFFYGNHRTNSFSSPALVRPSVSVYFPPIFRLFWLNAVRMSERMSACVCMCLKKSNISINDVCLSVRMRKGIVGQYLNGIM